MTSVERILTEKQVTQIEEEMLDWRKDCTKYRNKCNYLMKWVGIHCVTSALVGVVVGFIIRGVN